ncbi:MAG: hypothetical protein ACHQM4_08520 [Thermoanaerobaculia bacterium]
MSPAGTATGRLQLSGLALVSGSILAAQLILSRLFSATLGYYFAFMMVSLAMLGLASGALIVQQAPRFFRAERAPLLATVLSLAAGLSALGGTAVFLEIYPSVLDRSLFWSLAGVFCCFYPFFLASGAVVSLVLWHGREHFHRVYAVDLVGAASGSLLAVWALGFASPVDAMLWMGAILPPAAGILFSLGSGHRRGAIASLAACALLVGSSGLFLKRPGISDPPPVRRLKGDRLFMEWNAFSNVAVLHANFSSWALSANYAGPRFPMLELLIDGFGGTQIVQFDGKPASLRSYDYLDFDLTACVFRLLPGKARQLIIGPGGGVDILQSYRHSVRDITAVEINPLVAGVVNERLASFSGRPYHLPGVKVAIENGRTFIKRSHETWDLITLTWVDSGGSTTALAASENYLYTVEAYEEFLRHLEPGGFLAYLRSFGTTKANIQIDTLRALTATVEALRRLGVSDPSAHVVVAGSARSTFFHRDMCLVLVKREPFTTAEVDAVRRFVADGGFRPIWLPGGEPPLQTIPKPFSGLAPLYRSVLTTPDPRPLYRSAPLDIRPATDDNPFFWVERSGPNRDAGDGIRLLWMCCGILAALVLLFLGLPLTPLFRRTAGLELTDSSFLAYCSLLGAAFMLVEIELFQVFALVLGNPAYALGTVLVTVLLFSGLGSFHSWRFLRAGPLALGAAFLALVLFLATLSFAKEIVVSALVPAPIGWRIAGSVAVIAPLSFFMGIPMAAGMHLVRREDLMMWGWALNGAFSVLSSVAAVLLAIHVGIGATFAIGLLFYGLAGVLIQIIRRPAGAAAIRAI